MNHLNFNLLDFGPTCRLTSLADSHVICIYQYGGPKDAYMIQNFFEEPFMLSVKKEDEGANYLPDNWITT